MSSIPVMPLFERSLDYQIGSRVHSLMWHAKVSQTDMSKKLGIAQATISRKLRGERPFSTDELLQVAEMFGVTVSALFGQKEKDPAVAPGPSNESLHTESNRRPFHYNPHSNVHSITKNKRKKVGA